MSKSDAADLIDFGSVYRNGKQERNPSKKLTGSESIRVYWPWHGVRRFYEIDPDRILYRDDFLLAYNKEAGIPSQQTPSDGYNNLYAALQRFLSKETKSAYVALHHRLDQETSGVMLFGIDRAVNHQLGQAFRDQHVKKDYLAWVSGIPSQDSWTATEDIGKQGGRYTALPIGLGKSAETFFHVLVREQDRSLVWARPRTGRTHQIRIHLAASGHPVVGDRLYGGKPAKKLYLHACRLSLRHPVKGSKLRLAAPLPSDWPGDAGFDLPEEIKDRF